MQVGNVLSDDPVRQFPVGGRRPRLPRACLPRALSRGRRVCPYDVKTAFVFGKKVENQVIANPDSYRGVAISLLNQRLDIKEAFNYIPSPELTSRL